TFRMPQEDLKKYHQASYDKVPAGIAVLLSDEPDNQGLGPAVLTSYRQIRLANSVSQFKPANSRPRVLLWGVHSGIVTQPIIQIHGKTDHVLESVTYDIRNSSGWLTNQPGFITDDDFDEVQG